MANLAQITDGLCTLWRLADNAQIVLWSVDAREWLDRAPGVYAETLPPGQTPNPALSGVNKIVIGSRVSFRGPWDSRR